MFRAFSAGDGRWVVISILPGTIVVVFGGEIVVGGNEADYRCMSHSLGILCRSSRKSAGQPPIFHIHFQPFGSEEIYFQMESLSITYSLLLQIRRYVHMQMPVHFFQ